MAALLNRNGTFYAQFFDEARTPSRKRISLKTKDKSLARHKLARWERAWQLGEADPWMDDMEAILRPSPNEPSPTMEEAFEAFLRSRREMNCTKDTMLTYSGMLERFLRGKKRSHSAPRRLSSLTASELRAFIHAGGLAAATKDKRYRILRAFLGLHEEEAMLDPIGMPILDKRRPVGVRPNELRAICNEIKSDYRRLRRKNWLRPGELIWRIPVFWFTLLTGLRRSEIARLRWRDVDLDFSTLTLREQKSRCEERLPISEKAQQLLSRLPHRSGYVFRSPGGLKHERNERAWASNLSKRFRQYRKKADVREELDFHALRKGFCSELARKGASATTIKRLARHKSIETSLRYIEPDDSAAREALGGMF